MPNRKFVFDFDSTLTSVEGLDVLAEISLRNNPDKSIVVNKIQEITDRGIDGDISFSDSLSSRIALLNANKSSSSTLKMVFSWIKDGLRYRETTPCFCLSFSEFLLLSNDWEFVLFSF